MFRRLGCRHTWGVILLPIPSNKTSKKLVLTDLEAEIDGNTIIAGDFNSPLSAMEAHPERKLKKGALNLNHTLDQMYLTDIQKASVQQ